ncbi:MAG: protein phosphatase 2C domain-containing protein, partial [Planctomycetota bacterium]|nr:protein phosphatase 2C domain-containing protein [Planctomycetota bacterium]
MTQDPQLWKNHLRYVAVSDIGMRRDSNQDSHSVELASDVESWSRRGHLFLVADGMGAHAAGELASQLAADSIPHLYFKQLELSAPDSLKQAVEDSNSEINRKGQANQDFHNMGTTCSVLTLLPQGAVIAHVGDSRVYRLRGGVLEQLTFD